MIPLELVVISCIVNAIGAFFITKTAEPNSSMNEVRFVLIPLFLCILLIVNFFVGYSRTDETVEISSLTAERPVLAEIDAELIAVPRMDPDLQAMLKDVTGQPEPSVEVSTAAAEPVEPAPPVPTQSRWDVLAECESNGEWDYGPHSNWGNHLFEGGLQFHPDTWDAFKPSGYPAAAYNATRDQQIAVAERVLDAQGWKAWPACTRKLGWR